ncbi:MAG TPA: ABC transporter permease [Hyphomicrobiaceae bacterium]|nr:ABC transporter permease [Hyphomicrobiaceae bacterium]
MATISHPGGAAVLEQHHPRPSRWRLLWRFCVENPLGAGGGVVVLVMMLMALFAEEITRFDPTANNFGDMLTAPNLDYWLGTDQFGRDLYTRIVYGARTALLVGFVSAFAGATIGLVLGVVSAYFGGLFDLIFQRIMDVVMAFPLVILALAVVSIFGTGAQNVIIAITIPFIPRCARVVRSSALAIRETPFIDAARACGFGHTRIVLRHMVPNVMAPYIVMMTAAVGQAILIEASLSFLGLGVQEPTPAWGLMLRGGAQEYAESAPWVAIYPGVAISLAVFGFNLFGDALRDWLDPKMKV